MLLRTAFSPARKSRRRRFHFQPQPWKKSSFGARTRRPARRTLISRLGALSVQSSRFQSVIQRSATRQPTRCCLCISDCTTPHDLHSPSFPTCTCKRRRAASTNSPLAAALHTSFVLTTTGCAGHIRTRSQPLSRQRKMYRPNIFLGPGLKSKLTTPTDRSTTDHGSELYSALRAR